MAKWVRCRPPSNKGIWVNLENVLTLTQLGNGGTTIAFVGESGTLDVAEEPEEILRESGNATRP